MASRLCSWACGYGFCPIHSCFCTRTGPLNLPPPKVVVSGVKSHFGNDNGLCQFACSHGFCPTPECSSDDSDGVDSGSRVDIVVGYFQANSISTRGCAQQSANFVPTDSMSHINAAYAYIEADTFAIVPMRGAGTEQLRQLTDLKSQAPGLRVWLSLGGWDFSVGSGKSSGSQGIFAQMISSSTGRETFLYNLATFMRQWAFDGIDLDWRWPESEDEATNYALLLEEMRLYFNAQPAGSSAWGISFTAPVETSLLQLFDLTSMASSVNWINLVAYSDHSVDESTTHAMSDISLLDAALDVLGKAGVLRTQVNLGIGFFGRSYKLSDPATCSGIGCPATDFGVAGQCTGTPGFMSYDEIQQSFGKNTGTYDETTATNFIRYTNSAKAPFGVRSL